jgi:ferredoxin/flavodoxin---NADP+ reductase
MLEMATYTTERVIDVRHWSDKLFSFVTTRTRGLRFESGQFVMLGLPVDGKNVVRAYSIASANYEDHLEFFSIKVPHGPLTSRLQHIEVDSQVLVSCKPTGTLVLRDVRPGKRLIMLATGTGVAPFLALAKDPQTYESFEQVILARGARTSADLAYPDSVLDRLRKDSDLGGIVNAQLLDYPCVTRGSFTHIGRVTTLLDTGRLFDDLAIPALNPATDRFMICGNMRMVADAGRLLESRGLAISPHIGAPGDYVIERAFVETFAAGAEAQDQAHRGLAATEAAA